MASSNDTGRAYEYVCLCELKKQISRFRPCEVEENGYYFTIKRTYEELDEPELKANMLKAAEVVIPEIFDREPLIVEDGEDLLVLTAQTDAEGTEGDVRDIIIVRRDIHWEIGLSIKHNHSAAKHSRIGRTLDFGAKWYGVPCTQTYWDAISPIFERLATLKSQGALWRDMPDKEESVYVPLLNAFMEEVKGIYEEDNNILQGLIEYILGIRDYYKVISRDSKRATELQTYNLHGELGHFHDIEPIVEVPLVEFPTRIVAFEFKPNSSNTVELYMDEGWQMNFRLHNASSKVETSLKFDIQLIGQPTTIVSILYRWN